MARPQKEINWEEVELRIQAGNTAKQIYTHFRIDDNTFYDRFKKHYGCSFQDYSCDGYECGDGNLQYIQYKRALSGNDKQLTILGRHRLGQLDNKELEKSQNKEIHVHYPSDSAAYRGEQIPTEGLPEENPISPE